MGMLREEIQTVKWARQNETTYLGKEGRGLF
jgi:hypothetical protein